METWMEFVNKHGGMDAAIEVAPYQWVWPSGATAMASGGGLRGVHEWHEPPDDQRVRTEIQIKYFKAKLDQVAGEFARCKMALMGHGYNYAWNEPLLGPPPPDRNAMTGMPDGLAALEHIKAIYLEAEGLLHALESCLEAIITPPGDPDNNAYADELAAYQ